MLDAAEYHITHTLHITIASCLVDHIKKVDLCLIQ
jgi:hypothetical protein